MQKIILYSESTSLSTADVYWRVGEENKGLLKVQLEFDSEDSDSIGELAALRFLLFEKQVTGSVVTSGKNLHIELSKGAARKAYLGKSDKKHILKFGAFLQLIKDDLQVKVGKWRPGNDERARNAKNTEMLDVMNIEYAQPGIVFHGFPKFPKILITEHSLARYAERSMNESGVLKHPLTSLVKRLRHPDLQRDTLPKKVVEHKEKKYGKDGHVDVWRHPTSTINFGVLSNDSYPFPTLVTVFVKS